MSKDKQELSEKELKKATGGADTAQQGGELSTGDSLRQELEDGTGSRRGTGEEEDRGVRRGGDAGR